MTPDDLERIRKHNRKKRFTTCADVDALFDHISEQQAKIASQTNALKKAFDLEEEQDKEIARLAKGHDEYNRVNQLLMAENEKLEAEIERLKQDLVESELAEEAITQKLEGLVGFHGEKGYESVKTCACSYDAPDDICMCHSPAVQRLTERVKELEATIQRYRKVELRAAAKVAKERE